MTEHSEVQQQPGADDAVQNLIKWLTAKEEDANLKVDDALYTRLSDLCQRLPHFDIEVQRAFLNALWGQCRASSSIRFQQALRTYAPESSRYSGSAAYKPHTDDLKSAAISIWHVLFAAAAADHPHLCTFDMFSNIRTHFFVPTFPYLVDALQWNLVLPRTHRPPPASSNENSQSRPPDFDRADSATLSQGNRDGDAGPPASRSSQGDDSDGDQNGERGSTEIRPMDMMMLGGKSGRRKLNKQRVSQRQAEANRGHHRMPKIPIPEAISRESRRADGEGAAQDGEAGGTGWRFGPAGEMPSVAGWLQSPTANRVYLAAYITGWAQVARHVSNRHVEFTCLMTLYQLGRICDDGLKTSACWHLWARAQQGVWSFSDRVVRQLQWEEPTNTLYRNLGYDHGDDLTDVSGIVEGGGLRQPNRTELRDLIAIRKMQVKADGLGFNRLLSFSQTTNPIAFFFWYLAQSVVVVAAAG